MTSQNNNLTGSDTNEFDQKAREWDKNKMHFDRTVAIADQLQKSVTIKPGMSAMEFGAGTGLLSFHLKNLFSEILLVDTSPEMLKIAEEKMETDYRLKFRTLLLNLEKEAYHGGPFDIIYSQMVLHHIRDTRDILQKFFHLLKPGGILAIADLYTEDGSFHDGDPNVHKGFDPENLVSVLSSLGFHNSRIDPCFVIKKVGQDESIKEFPVFLMTAFR
jgi:tRNA (cmo5U34)-methyltransferase